MWDKILEIFALGFAGCVGVILGALTIYSVVWLIAGLIDNFNDRRRKQDERR